MKKRIFLAIDLSGAVKKEISKYQKKWPELPIRWVKPENLHITILFMGYVSDDALVDILNAAEKVAEKADSFNIQLNKIIYGPPGQKMPRMVWLDGEAPEEMANLKENLEKELINTKSFHYWNPEQKDLKLHITLGRIKGMEFRQMEYPPEINEKVNFQIPVCGFNVMESNLKRTGPEYTILREYYFQ